MSKAADNLQRRFGQNLSESLGVRAPGGGVDRAAAADGLSPGNQPR